MVIHPSRQLPQDLRICLAKAELPALMTVARLHGKPSERDLEATIKAGGFSALTATLKVLSGHEDRAMRERFEGLKSYPTGSFGKAYADFIEINQFDFPGTPGGPPPPVFRHDCCHVLGGYGTTAAEEGAVLGF